MPPKGTIKYEWNKIRVFINEVELETFLRNDEHRNISKNGSRTQKCNECDSVEIHHMVVIYRCCTSVKCQTVQGDTCPFRYKIHKCEKTGACHLYETQLRHLDVNIELNDKPFGIHSAIKDQIKKCYSQNIHKPLDISVTLSTNQENNSLLEGIKIPNTVQINRQVAKMKNPEEKNEYQLVIEQLNDLIYQPNKDYDPNQAFCFGCKIGDGSDSSHFIANFTSLKLLETISKTNFLVTNNSVYYIDTTYEITKTRYPLIVIGRMDHSGTFFPICVSLSSHEQTVDFNHILDSLKSLCSSLNISFQPSCFFQDACQASKIAIERVFEPCKVLTSWYHVIQNVKQNQNLIPPDEFDRVKEEIENMHYSKNEYEFEAKRDNAIARWSSVSDLNSFSNYFEENWLESEFNSWQIYASFPGFASTNNPLEGFNGRIKKFLKKKEASTIHSAIQVICKELVAFYSLNYPEFKWVRLPDSTVKKISKELDNQSFIQENENTIVHYGLSSNHTIDIFKKCCDCRWFLAYGICSHIFKASELFGFSINNEPPTRFVARPLRGRESSTRTLQKNDTQQVGKRKFATEVESTNVENELKVSKFDF